MLLRGASISADTVFLQEFRYACFQGNRARGPTLDRDVVCSRRGVHVLKDIDRRVLVPASDARVVSVVDGYVQRRSRDGRVHIAVLEYCGFALKFQIRPAARVEDEAQAQQLYEEVWSVTALRVYNPF